MRVLNEEPNDQEPCETWFHSEQSIPQEKTGKFCVYFIIYLPSKQAADCRGFQDFFRLRLFSWLSELIL